MSEAKPRFVVGKEPPVFRHPVRYQRPQGEGFETVEFAADFRMLGEKRFNECLALAQTGEMSDRAFADELLAAHHGVEDEKGNALSHDELLNLDGMSTAIVSAYVEARMEIIIKNSKAPLAAG